MSGVLTDCKKAWVKEQSETSCFKLLYMTYVWRVFGDHHEGRFTFTEKMVPFIQGKSDEALVVRQVMGLYFGEYLLPKSTFPKAEFAPAVRADPMLHLGASATCYMQYSGDWPLWHEAAEMALSTMKRWPHLRKYALYFEFQGRACSALKGGPMSDLEKAEEIARTTASELDELGRTQVRELAAKLRTHRNKRKGG